jgi:hypothetical protein
MSIQHQSSYKVLEVREGGNTESPAETAGRG